jgi:hypothetical protein
MVKFGQNKLFGNEAKRNTCHILSKDIFINFKGAGYSIVDELVTIIFPGVNN